MQHAEDPDGIGRKGVDHGMGRGSAQVGPRLSRSINAKTCGVCFDLGDELATMLIKPLA
jgi:hypothetical protein